MSKFLLVIYLLGLATQCDGFRNRGRTEVKEEEEEVVVVDSGIVDGVCRGDDGNMDPSELNKIDKVIQRFQGSRFAKFTIKRIMIAMKNPSSPLRMLLGKAGQDPSDPDFDQSGGEMTGNANLELINFLSKFVGQTKTVIGYLWQFGFIAKVMNKSQDAAENYNGKIPPCAVTNAIKEFQLFNQISPADGVLTKETLDMMAKDRCGNPDVKCETEECQAEDAVTEEGSHLRKKRYTVKSKKWKETAGDGGIVITYYFENFYEPDTYAEVASAKRGHHVMTKESVKEEVENGFRRWAKHAKLYFYEVDNRNDADIKILFGAGRHGEKRSSNSFDGQYGTLAHMFYPRSGKMHFDAADNFMAAKTGSGFNLQYIAAHEMGHGLGIEHRSVEYAC